MGGLLVSITLMIFLVACIVTKDSPAPGCDKYLGCAPMGGCFGKTVIQDLQVEGAPECLSIRVNNCNGGVIDVENNCEIELILDSLRVEPGEYAILDVAQNDQGGFGFIQIPSNFSDYIPELDQNIQISGQLEHKEIIIRFTKTAPLCE